MDNNILAEMQNWKKQLIMDPVLNALFDRSLNTKDFLHTKILTLDHNQIVQIYSKLSSLKHALSKSIQKEVQAKHNLIEQSFMEKWKLTQKVDLKNELQIKTNQKNFQNFNKKYETVQSKLNSYRNTQKIIQFGKALQKFKINSKMLKTFMKDYSKQVEDSKLSEALNTLKISKLLKQLNDLCTKNDFTGITIYESQKNFINNTKGIVYSITEKQANNLIQKLLQSFKQQKSSNNKSAHQQLLLSEIESKLLILSLINKLKDFITNFFKGTLKQVADLLTKLFQSFLPMKDFKDSLKNVIALKIINSAKLMLLLEQILIKSRLTQVLKSFNFPNLFEKYWEKLIQYFVDLIKWSLQQESKDKQKQQSFAFLNIKLKNSLIMKYPVLFSWMSAICCIVHLYILQNIKLKSYEFHLKKEKFMLILIPLSKKYYETIEKQFSEQKLSQNKQENIQKITNKVKKFVYSQKYYQAMLQVISNAQNNSNILHNLFKIFLQIIKKNETNFSFILKQLKSSTNTEQQKSSDIEQNLKQIIKRSVSIFDNPILLKKMPTIQSVINITNIIKQIKNNLQEWNKLQLTS